MKILFVATVRSHIGQFHMPFIRELKARGVEVHAAFKDNSADKPGLDLSAIDKTFEVPFERRPLRPNNIKAYRELKRLLTATAMTPCIATPPWARSLPALRPKARAKGDEGHIHSSRLSFFKGASIKTGCFSIPWKSICRSIPTAS